LTDLTSLNLSFNQLTELPPEIVQLSKLTSLALSGSQLTELPPEIVQLTDLTSLDLSFNKLTELPPEIVQFRQLKKLELENNQLTNLPKEIGQLNKLRRLALRNNNFQTLPSEIGLLKLTQLTHGNNPLTSPPSSVRKQGTKAILNFLKQQLEQDVDYLYEAKLLIIGEPGAGKTTLAQKINDPNYNGSIPIM